MDLPIRRPPPRFCFRALLGLLTFVCTAAQAEVTHLDRFGGDVITWPRGIAADASGRIYVGDFDLGRDIEVFAEDLTSLGAFGGAEVARPSGIAVDEQGTIYVGDFDTGRVHRFDAAFRYLGSFGESDLGWPAGVSIGPAGRIYVAAMRPRHVDVYGPDLQLVGRFGAGLFNRPTLFAFGPGGSIYVSDRYTGVVHVFDADFSHQETFGSDVLTSATGVVVDPAKRIHVADLDADEIVVFDATRRYLTRYGAPHLDGPTGLLLGDAGKIYVADTLDNDLDLFFDSDAWVQGENVFPAVRVGAAEAAAPAVGLGTLFTLAAGMGLEVSGSTVIAAGGALHIEGGRFQTEALRIDPDARLEVSATALDLRAATEFLNEGEISVQGGEMLRVRRLENHGGLHVADSALQGSYRSRRGGAILVEHTATLVAPTHIAGCVVAAEAGAELVAEGGRVRLGRAVVKGVARFRASDGGYFDAGRATFLGDGRVTQIRVESDLTAGNWLLEIGGPKLSDQIEVDGARLQLRGEIAVQVLPGAAAPRRGSVFTLISTRGGGRIEYRGFRGLAPGGPFVIERQSASELSVRFVPRTRGSHAGGGWKSSSVRFTGTSWSSLMAPLGQTTRTRHTLPERLRWRFERPLSPKWATRSLCPRK